VKRRNFITLLGGATKSGACAGIIEGQAARRLDSERVEPFVDISGLFAAKCPQ
jgi:hypothetical protein